MAELAIRVGADEGPPVRTAAVSIDCRILGRTSTGVSAEG